MYLDRLTLDSQSILALSSLRNFSSLDKRERLEMPETKVPYWLAKGLGTKYLGMLPLGRDQFLENLGKGGPLGSVEIMSREVL